MSNSSNWPIAVTGYDSLRIMTKRVDRASRNASPISAADLLGPGMSSQAVHILDWNDEVATFNGFFYTTAGGLNSPVVQNDEGEDIEGLPWIGTVIAREDGTGTQQLWNTDDPGSMYFRVRNWAPNLLDPDAPPIFGDWQRFATRSGFIAEEDLHPDVRDMIDQALADAEEALGLIVPANYIFRQDEPPVATPDRDLLNYDIWFDTNDSDLMYVYFDGAWVLPDEEILSGAGASAAAALAAAQAAANDAAAAILAADGKNTTYRQTTAPTGGTYVVGDTWEDTDDLNKPYRWNGSAWVLAITGWLETDTTAARGVKITSTGLVAYNSSGSPTFTIVGSTGSVVMTGDLAVGSTITGATVTGTLQTTTTANRGVKITSTGMVIYDTGGSVVLSYSSTTGILSVTGPIVSGANISGSSVTASAGGVIQSESTASRGVKINSAGLTAYDGSGSPTFVLTGSTGAVTMTGGVISGADITASEFSTIGYLGDFSNYSIVDGSGLSVISGTQKAFVLTVAHNGGGGGNLWPGLNLTRNGSTFAKLVYTGSLLRAIGADFWVDQVLTADDVYVASMPSFTPSTHLPVYRNTTTGRLFMSTSSERYKTEIEDADLDFDGIVRAIRTVTYKSKAEYVDPGNEDLVMLGAIAEEFAAHPLLERFVAYNAEGQPEGIDYPGLIIPLVGAYQTLAARVAALEAA